MSWTTVVLAIIVIILIYVLYVYFVSKSNVLASSASLLSGNNQPITTINSGQSTQYAYGIWVYVNTWNTTTQKIIFSRANNITLYLDANTPSLYVQIAQVSGQNPVNAPPILITDNFPIQKWTYVVVSSDTMIIDCYLDGKLVNSTKLANSPAVPANGSPVVLGTGWDCYIAGFQNWAGPIGPQQAWDSYMSGNGNAVSQFFGQYSINIAVNKNNVQQSSYTMNL
jgi:Concanavalin A-like lectin/glucanases superfamily